MQYHTAVTTTTEVKLYDKNDRLLKAFSLRDVLKEGLSRAYGWEQD
jgi:hypothetical protein